MNAATSSAPTHMVLALQYFGPTRTRELRALVRAMLA
jgi:hypothetical protein